MAAKATTPEQMNQFHLAMTGFTHCFDDCCLCKATNEVTLLQLEVAALGSELLILQQENISWKLYAKAMHRAMMEEDLSFAHEAWRAISEDLQNILTNSLVELTVFSNEYEWVIAEILSEALDIVKETTGYDYSGDETYDWKALSDENTLAIWLMNEMVAEIEEEGSTLITKTCGEWIEHFGKGYLCSSEM